MAEIVLKDGKTTVEVECEWFADPGVPPDFVMGHRFDEATRAVVCPLFRDCYTVYTRRA